MFNIGKGRLVQLVRASATLKLLILKTSDTDANLIDLDTVAAILAATNVEANFTNYARATLSSVTVTVDDTGNAASIDCADVTFTSAGGGTNNTTTDAIIYYDPGGGDSNCIPLCLLDCVFTTNGQNVTLQMHASGFYGVS
jgi:hypothetical protein